PAVTQRLGDGGQGVPGTQHLGANDMGGEVAVTEGEPVRLRSVGGELASHGEGLVGPAPALPLLNAAAERVHDGVEVGADVQAVQNDVVGGVADHGDVGVGDGLA